MYKAVQASLPWSPPPERPRGEVCCRCRHTAPLCPAPPATTEAGQLSWPSSGRLRVGDIWAGDKHHSYTDISHKENFKLAPDWDRHGENGPSVSPIAWK